MISRGIQRSCTGIQSIDQGERVYFNKSILSWTSGTQSPPSITYNAGYFNIPQASISDYVVSWTISTTAATKLDTLDNNFLLKMSYSNGEVTDECFCSNISAMGTMSGYKIIHISRKGKDDLLKIFMMNRGFYNTIYLTNSYNNVPASLSMNDICNATICIFSI